MTMEQARRGKVVWLAALALVGIAAIVVLVMLVLKTRHRPAGEGVAPVTARADAAAARPLDRAPSQIVAAREAGPPPKKPTRRPRRLSDRELRVAQRRNAPLLRSCGVRHGTAGRPTKATVLVQIADGGRVRKVVVDAAGDRELAECLRRMVRSWRFPADLKAQELVFPVVLGGGQ